MKIQIKHRFTGAVLFEHDVENNTISLTLSLAIKAKADLSGANLSGADLSGADLSGADLSWADLSRANLSGADLAEGVKIASSQRPVFQISGIGSKARTFIGFMTEVGIRLRAGCFFGSVDEFRVKLKETHGTLSVHAVEYEAALALMILHFKLWPAASSAEVVSQNCNDIPQTVIRLE